MHDPIRLAHAAALAMFARRDLSEARLRQALARKGHERAAVDEAVARLRAAGVVDDRRVALSAARTEASVRSRGRARVMLRLQALGIPEDVARSAADEVFAGLDEAAVLERAIERRLRGPARQLRDAGQFRRLFQQLVRQGFPAPLVMRALRARARHEAIPDEEI